MLTGEQETLGIFGITPIGAALVVLAIVYMSLGRWILPKRKARADEADYLRLDRYYTEVIVEAKSRWIGQPMADFNRYYDGRLEVVEWLRNGVPQHNKNRGSVLAEGDVLFVSATPDEIVSVESEPGLALHAVKKYGESTERDLDDAPQLVQVVVAPHSPFIGETIAEVDFLKTFDVVVVGMWRRQAWIRDRLSQVKLNEGDLLVLRGTRDRFAELASHHGILMMVPFSGRPRRRQHAVRTLLIVTARRGRGRVRRRPGADGIPRRRCRAGPDRLRQRRSRLPRDRRAHLRDDRRRHSAGSRHGADRYCGLPRGTAPAR